MESLLNRYRNITVLLLVILAQLVLLAVSAKNDQDVRMIRVWTVTAVTPLARIVEGIRGGGDGFLRNYVLLHDSNEENKKLHAEVDQLRLRVTFLENELNTADRAKALQMFQAHTPSKMLAAKIIGVGAGPSSNIRLVDRGTINGVQRGMGVVTPDGIVGKVVAAYPPGSHVQLITEPDFAAGVVTKTGSRGTLKGQGTPLCRVDYVPFEEKVEVGDWVYTSGDDRIFPRGFVVGQVKSVRPGQPFKEILVEPSGLRRGLEDVLIVMEGVHQDIPETPPTYQPVYIANPPAAPANAPQNAQPVGPGGTEADRLESVYKSLGQAQGHDYGDNPIGTKPMDFTKLSVPAGTAPTPATATPGGPATAPPNAPPDSARRSNQAAGGPPGGQDR
jgi:rod shape-determining protein MreC